MYAPIGYCPAMGRATIGQGLGEGCGSDARLENTAGPPISLGYMTYAPAMKL